MQRAMELGRGGDPAALPELIGLLRLPSNEVQRLAASAIGKLAEFGADKGSAVAALGPLALSARHPQTQQYAIRALSKYGAAAKGCVHDLRDLARNPTQRDYVRAAAATSSAVIELAAADAETRVKHRCQRCGAGVTADEFARSQQAFQRIFCDRCFDEVFLEMSMYKKQTLYQQEGNRLISVYPRDLSELDGLLTEKLCLFGYRVGTDAGGKVGR